MTNDIGVLERGAYIGMLFLAVAFLAHYLLFRRWEESVYGYVVVLLGFSVILFFVIANGDLYFSQHREMAPVWWPAVRHITAASFGLVLFAEWWLILVSPARQPKEVE